MIKDGAKMSKSKGNVVDPHHLIEKYGADTARLFSLFAAPPEKDLEWSDKGVEGAQRFFHRLWGIVFKNRESLHVKRESQEQFIAPSHLTPDALRIYRKTHQTIKKVVRDIEREYHFNTAIASLMELLNELTAFEPQSDEDWTTCKFAIDQMLLLLSPFAPHCAEELWEAIGNKPSIFDQQWPAWDENSAREETIELVIQINGKVRSKVMISPGTPDNEIERIALEDQRIKGFIGTKAIKKIIIVKSKLVNIVIGG